MAETDTVVAQGYARVMVDVDEYRRLTEAADLIARLQAENEALRRERDEARGNLSPLTLEVLTDIQRTAAELRQEDFQHVSVNTLMGAVKMFIAATRLLCQTAAAEAAQKAAEAAREAAEAKAARLEEAMKWMRDRDDRNGSLPQAYRDKLDAALEAK